MGMEGQARHRFQKEPIMVLVVVVVAFVGGLLLEDGVHRSRASLAELGGGRRESSSPR